ncbi:MAG: hypothetical protein ACOC9P_00985, partial [bacterium]
CLARVRQSMLMLETYRNDYNGWLPAPRTDANGGGSHAMHNPDRWGVASDQLAAGDAGATVLKQYATDADMSALNCPQGPWEKLVWLNGQMLTDYLYLGGLGPDAADEMLGAETFDAAVPANMHTASAMPAEMAVVTDMAFVQPGQQGENQPVPFKSFGNDNDGIEFNHFWGINAAYGDGHAQWLDIDQLDYVASDGNIRYVNADGLMPPAPAGGYFE